MLTSFDPGRASSALPPPASAWKCAVSLCALFLAAGPIRLEAQSSTSGAIAGRAPTAEISFARASICARETGTGVLFLTQASRAGDFLLTNLPPGDYTVDVTSPGLPPARREHIPVTLGETTDLRALRPHSDFTSNPFAGPQSLGEESAATLPGANPDSDSAGEALPSMRGLSSTENSTRMDGGEQIQRFSSTPAGAGAPIGQGGADDASEGASDEAATGRGASARSIRGAAVPYTFARSAIREFHLTGSTYSALYGSSPGGILTAVSRSGSAQFHGDAFLLLRNSAFAATNPYAIATTYTDGVITSAAVKPHDVRQQFGGALGGPILKRRAFFFFAFDGQRRGFPAISSPQDPNFYTLTPTQRALLANRGVSRAAINTSLNYLDSLTGSTPRRADGNVAFTRLDFHPYTHLAATLQYNRSRWNQPAAALSAPVVSRGRASLGNTADKVDTAVARIILPITVHLSNEFLVQYGRDLRFQTPQPPLPQEPAIGPEGLPPEVAISPQGLTFGTPASLGRAAYPDERRLELADLLSLVHGRHHVQVGGDLARIHTFVSALPNQQGTFHYDSEATTPGRAGGLVDFITDATFNVNAYPNGGCPSIYAAIHLFCFRSFTQSFGEQAITFDSQEWNVYLQDDWRVLPRLTLHAGLRYDDQALPPPQHPNPALDAIFGTEAATVLFPEDRNNIAPRAALAWQPASRLTLRAGYGVYFGRVPGATLRSALLDTDLPTSTTHIRILPSTITDCPQVQHQGFGYPCAYVTSPAASLPDTTSATLFSRRFRLPMIQQASATAEVELPSGITAAVTYRMNLDRQLPGSVDLNIAPSTMLASYQLQGGLGTSGIADGETFVLPLYTARLTNTVGPVTAITSSATATYNGLTVEARRTARSLTFNASFTWSRAIDFNPTQGAIPRTDSQLDPFNLRYDRALSSLNFPYRFSGNALWRPRVASHSRTLRLAANGWLLAPHVLVRSGAPFSFTVSGGTRLAGGAESINRSGGALYLPTIGRNTGQLPTAANVDLRLARDLKIRDSVSIRLSAEAYNLTNRVNISGVTQRAYLVGTPVAGVTPLIFQDPQAIATEGLNTRAFGTYTDSGTNDARARDLQFGLHLQF